MDENYESSYLQYLPAVLQESRFLGRFLIAFEQMLSGLPDEQAEEFTLPSPQAKSWNGRGIEQVLDHINDYFDPMKTPEEFLPWLAHWVALSLRDDWTQEEKRRLIQQAIPLYKKRGTLEGLRQMLLIYLNAQDESPEVQEQFVQIQVWDGPMQLGVASTIGEDTIVGEPDPHHFRVKLLLTDLTYVDFTRKQQIAQAIIEQEKPAHTTYELEVKLPSLQIGKFSKIGVDTVLTDEE
jgi:phage tail-like protein